MGFTPSYSNKKEAQHAFTEPLILDSTTWEKNACSPTEGGWIEQGCLVYVLNGRIHVEVLVR